MKYNEATVALRKQWDAWAEASGALIAARSAYHAAAKDTGVRLCQHCDKPMPDYDHSMTCDGCHLGWGWDTPQARRDRRAEQLDAEIERLRAERAKL